MISDKLHIKEVFVGEGTGRRRYVIAYNPQQAKQDRINREQILERLSCELEVLNKKHTSQNPVQANDASIDGSLCQGIEERPATD